MSATGLAKERNAARIYDCFLGGKAQLGMETAEAHAREQVEVIDRAAAEAGSAAEFVERYVDLGRDGMVASGYGPAPGPPPGWPAA